MTTRMIVGRKPEGGQREFLTVAGKTTKWTADPFQATSFDSVDNALKAYPNADGEVLNAWITFKPVNVARARAIATLSPEQREALGL